VDYNALACLVERARQGDQDAFQRIYDAFSKTVFYTAIKVVKNQEDANDVLQETMITLYKNLDSIENSRAVFHYVNKVAYSHCIRLLRKKKLLGVDDDAEQVLDNVADDDEFVP